MRDARKTTQRELKQAEAAEKAAERHVDRLRADAAQERHAAASAREAKVQSGADAVLSGASAMPGIDLDPLAMEGKADSLDVAAVRVAASVPGLKAKVEAARVAATDAALASYRTERDRALADLSAVLAGAAGPLARLLAADDVRGSLIGSRFVFDPQSHPPSELWSASHLANAFLDAIPGRAMPPGLRAHVAALSEELARGTLQELGENDDA